MRVKLQEVDDHHDVHLYEESMDGIQQVLDYCKYMRDTRQYGPPDCRNYGVIPAIIQQKYMNEAGITFADFMRNPEHHKRLLNDPALKGFRIYPGRV